MQNTIFHSDCDKTMIAKGAILKLFICCSHKTVELTSTLLSKHNARLGGGDVSDAFEKLERFMGLIYLFFKKKLRIINQLKF